MPSFQVSASFETCFIFLTRGVLLLLTIVVVNKSDPFMFDKFIDNVQQIKIHELKIAETFDEFIGSNVLDDSISVEDTTELLDSYIEAVDTDLNKDRMKTTMRSLYVEAQDKEIA